MTDVEALVAAKACRANSAFEVHLPDEVFMPLSRLTDSWFGVFAGGFRQRLTLGQYDQLVREAQYRLERQIVEAVIEKLTP